MRLREELYQAIGEGSVVLDKEDKNILLGKKSKNWLRRLPLLGKKKKAAAPVQQTKTVVLQVEVQAEDAEDVMRELQKMGLEPVKKLP